MATRYPSVIIPDADTPLWSLGEQLAALGGVRGQTFEPVQATPRWGYAVTDELYRKWQESQGVDPDKVADQGDADQSRTEDGDGEPTTTQAAAGGTGQGTDARNDDKQQARRADDQSPTGNGTEDESGTEDADKGADKASTPGRRGTSRKG